MGFEQLFDYCDCMTVICNACKTLYRRLAKFIKYQLPLHKFFTNIAFIKFA